MDSDQENEAESDNREYSDDMELPLYGDDNDLESVVHGESDNQSMSNDSELTSLSDIEPNSDNESDRVSLEEANESLEEAETEESKRAIYRVFDWLLGATSELELSRTEKVARMLVDHFIHFKGCDHHTAIMDESGMSMREFIERRDHLLEQMPEWSDPDFAQPDRLSVNARLPGDPKDEVKDEWKKLGGKPL